MSFFICSTHYNYIEGVHLQMLISNRDYFISLTNQSYSQRKCDLFRNTRSIMGGREDEQSLE